MEKKGLSPLASTILLLLLSILIGVAVMTWGKSYVEQATVGQDVVVPQEKTILEDLNERLEKGDITKSQYDKMKAVILEQNGN